MAIGQLVDWSVAGTHKQPERAMSYVCAVYVVSWETAASSDNKQKPKQNQQQWQLGQTVCGTKQLR